MTRPIDYLAGLDQETLDEVLGVLTSPRRVRADAIRSYWARPDGRRLADVLMDLEVDGEARSHVIATLRRMTAAQTA